MNKDDFKRNAHMLIDWMAEYYFDDVKDLPVKAQVMPGDIRSKIPAHPPKNGEAFEPMFEDFKTGYPARHHSLAAPTLFCVFSRECKSTFGARGNAHIYDGHKRDAVGNKSRRDRARRSNDRLV